MADVEVPCTVCGRMTGYSRREWNEMLAYGIPARCVNHGVGA